MSSQSLLLAVVAVLLALALGYMFWKRQHPPASATFAAPITAIRYNMPAPDPSAGGRAVVVTQTELSPGLVGLKASATVAIAGEAGPAGGAIKASFMPYTGTIAAIDGASVTLSPTPRAFTELGGNFAVAVTSGGLAVYLPRA